jgi:methanogenic corrinoid protein MtbC1
MQKTVLSTADVARLFNVTETTVKRWADEGALKCQKTPGGHRKFVIKYVIEFAEKNNIEPLGALDIQVDEKRLSRLQLAILERDMRKLSEEFVERMLSRGMPDLLNYLSYLYEHKIPLWQIYDAVLRSGLEEIGRLWEQGRIGIEHEHRATNEVLDALARLQSQIHMKEPLGKTVLLGCLGEELHTIGLRCIAYLFEAEGWQVYFLGGQIPLSSMTAAVEQVRPHAVCVSATYETDPASRRDSLNIVAAAAHDIGAIAIVGGRAALEIADLHQTFDFVAATSRDVDLYLNSGTFSRISN